MPQPPATFELLHYARVLWRRRWVLLLALVVVMGSSFGVSLLQTPLYEGTAELVIRPQGSELLFRPEAAQRDPERSIRTEIRVLKSAPVRRAVRARLGAEPGVSAKALTGTDSVLVKARSRDAKQAALIANTYAQAYIDHRRSQSVEDLVAAGQGVQAKITELQDQMDALEAEVSQAQPGQRTALEAKTSARRNNLRQQLSLFEQRLDQIQLEASLSVSGAQLVTPAAVPTEPVSPRPERTLALAALGGLVLGMGSAFLLERLDDSLRTSEDVERALPHVPVVARIPSVEVAKKHRKMPVASLRDPGSPAAEAYRSLRTAVQFADLHASLRTLQVTSPGAGDGKSTTVANLGVALARSGKQVILVCCDLRRPRLHDLFGLPNDIGFTSTLLGDTTLDDALQPVPGVERLSVLASGPLPPNPSELLSAEATTELLASLVKRADLVLLDGSPVLPVTDGVVLARHVDATAVVVRASRTTSGELQHAVRTLEGVGARVLGTILNGVKAQDEYSSGYYYSASNGGARTEERLPARSTDNGRSPKHRRRRGAEVAAQDLESPLDVAPPAKARDTGRG